MDDIIVIGEIILRAVSSIVVLFLLTKLLGKQQISQLNFFDYCIGISIGSIAASMAIEDDRPFHYPLIAMIVYALIAFLLSYVTDKSIRARHVINGTPVILIDNGKLLRKNMKKVRVDLNELLCECRVAGYFDISQIEYAVMETNGRVSILPKSQSRPVQPSDMNMTPAKASLCANVIMDGNIMRQNLKNIGKDEQWLNSQLKLKKIGSHKDVFLATCDENGALTVFERGEKPHSNNVFE